MLLRTKASKTVSIRITRTTWFRVLVQLATIGTHLPRCSIRQYTSSRPTLKTAFQQQRSVQPVATTYRSGGSGMMSIGLHPIPPNCAHLSASERASEWVSSTRSLRYYWEALNLPLAPSHWLARARYMETTSLHTITPPRSLARSLVEIDHVSHAVRCWASRHQPWLACRPAYDNQHYYDHSSINQYSSISETHHHARHAASMRTPWMTAQEDSL